MRLITFASAGAFILFAAMMLKKENTGQPVHLYNTKWSLKKIHGVPGVEEVQTKAFLKFNGENKSAGGNGSCNSFGSSTTIHQNEISFKNIFSTKMYCEEVQKTEDAFFKQLGKVTRFEIKDNRLLLYEDKELLLEFLAEPGL